MAEIQAWPDYEVECDTCHATLQDPDSYMPTPCGDGCTGTVRVVRKVIVANTPENIEAIKDAARDAIEAHHKAKRAEGVLWKDIDDVDAILWVLGLTGGGK